MSSNSPEDVEDVEHGDGDEDGGEEAAEVAVLPVLDDDDEEDEVEDEGDAGEDGPACPPPVTFRLNHLQRKNVKVRGCLVVAIFILQPVKKKLFCMLPSCCNLHTDFITVFVCVL